MQAVVAFVVAAVKAAGPFLWPIVKPICIAAGKQLLADLLAAAKTQALPPAVSFLAAPIASVEAELQKLIDAPASV